MQFKNVANSEALYIATLLIFLYKLRHCLDFIKQLIGDNHCFKPRKCALF